MAGSGYQDGFDRGFADGKAHQDVDPHAKLTHLGGLYAFKTDPPDFDNFRVLNTEQQTGVMYGDSIENPAMDFSRWPIDQGS